MVRQRMLGRWLLILTVNVLLLEVFSGVAFESGILLSSEIYRSSWFDCESCKRDAYVTRLGWDVHYPNRMRPSETSYDTCASAFGDSFTHADEVSDAEAWPALLSHELKCKVENYGVGGYGQDQAYLKYLDVSPRSRYVMLGMNREMLRRNFAGSWRFYASRKDSLPKPYFLHTESSLLRAIEPPGLLTPRALQEHHRFDRFYEPYRVRFPYTLSFLRVLRYRMDTEAYALNRLEPRNIAWKNTESLDLSFAITRKFLSRAKESGSMPVLILFPHTSSIYKNVSPYKKYYQRLREGFPDLCVVDPLDALHAEYVKNGPLHQPKKHYNYPANQAVARAVFLQMNTCILSGRTFGVTLPQD